MKIYYQRKRPISVLVFATFLRHLSTARKQRLLLPLLSVLFCLFAAPPAAADFSLNNFTLASSERVFGTPAVLSSPSQGRSARKSSMPDQAQRARKAYGLTPAEDSVCDDLPRALFGLCNAYCEAMDCDSDNPRASERACNKVLNNFMRKSGGEKPPCVNTAPVADAGPDQTVFVGNSVQLDGSASSDPDGDAITFSWTLSTKPAGSTATLSDPAAGQPAFTADAAGQYVARLVVNDGLIDSDPDSVTITAEIQNTAPVADAGPDQTVFVGNSVQLDGSASSDPDGDAITFAWTLVTRPAGSGATLSDPAAAQPAFIADLAGQYVAQLVVNDGLLDSDPDSTTVTAQIQNTAPVADAGEDRTYTLPVDQTEMAVTLDASGSTDPEGNISSYIWTGNPDPTDLVQTEVTLGEGVYIFTLVVHDQEGAQSSPAGVMITVVSTADACASEPSETCVSGEFRQCGVDVGECQSGVEHCEAGFWSGVCVGETTPVPEILDGLDNNCNSEVDEGLWTLPQICENPGNAVYVDASAPQGGGGHSWETAFNDLQSAINATGDCDEIWVKAGTYTPLATIELNHPLRLFGGFAGNEVTQEARNWQEYETIIDGDESTHCMNLTADAVLDGFIFTRCRVQEGESDTQGGALQLRNASVLLRNAVFRNNSVDRDSLGLFWDDLGGAIYSDNASLFVESTVFQDNLAAEYGGAIYANESSVTIRDSVFRGNRTAFVMFAAGRGGGAIYSRFSSVNILDTRFEHNQTNQGAIHTVGGEIIINGSTFSENEWGGAIHGYKSKIVVSDSEFVRNNPYFPPHTLLGICVICNESGSLKITGSLLTDNGPGAELVIRSSGETVVTDSTFIGNYISAIGGGTKLSVINSQFLRNLGTAIRSALTTTIVNSDFLENEAGLVGKAGAVYSNADSLTISGSRFIGNVSSFEGGAINLDNHSNAHIFNSLFTRNYSEDRGSAIYVDDNSQLTAINNTFVTNVNSRLDGSVVGTDYKSNAFIANSIIWGNTPNRVRRYNWYNSTAVVSNSITSDYLGSFGNIDANPMFVNLPKGDFRLTAGSPAIDAGATAFPDDSRFDMPEPPDFPVADLEGQWRNIDGDADGTGLPDMGAYEYVLGRGNLPPVAVAGGDKTWYLNGTPFGVYAMNGQRSCDADGDTLTYVWFGPLATASGPSPDLPLPEGTSLVSLLVTDRVLANDLSEFSVTTIPCLELTAVAAPGVVELSWAYGKGVESYDVFRAKGSDRSVFRKVGETTSTDYLDDTVDDDPPYLYMVGRISGGEMCTSNVVAAHLPAAGVPMPANHTPAIYSKPASYGPKASEPFEPTDGYWAVYGIRYGYDVNAADPDGDPLNYRMPVHPPGMEIDPASGLVTWLPNQAGMFEVTVEAVDSSGEFDSQSFTLIVENRPPVARAGTDQVIASSGMQVQLNGGESYDLDGEPLSYSWSFVSIPERSAAAPVLVGADTANPSFTAVEHGRYELRLIVNDGAADSAPDTVVVTTLNTPPIAKLLNNYVSFTLDDVIAPDSTKSVDFDDDPITYHWSFLLRPVGSEAVISETTANPSIQVDVRGSYLLRLVVNDGQTDSWADTWRFDVVNRRPIADSGPDQTVTTGDTVNLDCSASSDPDGDPINCKWGLSSYSMPTGSLATLSALSGATTSFVPDVAGTYQVQLTVDDGQDYLATDTTYITINAILDNLPPEIVSDAPLSATVGQTYSYEVIAVDPNTGDTLVYSLVSPPAGMSIDPATGVIQWTPDSAQVGDNPVGVSVADEEGLEDTQSFTITVAGANKPPWMACIPPQTATEGRLFERRANAEDPNPEDSLTYTLLSSPAGMTIDPASGLIAWTPTGSDLGENQVVVQATDAGLLADTRSFKIMVMAAADVDGDYDGFTVNQGDCDDNDRSIHPDAIDVAGNGIDENCDGVDAEVSVRIDSLQKSLYVPLGDSGNITHTIYFDTAGAPYTLEFSQELQPDTGGAQVVSEFPAESYLGTSEVTMAYSEVYGDTVGSYELVTRLVVRETGQTEEIVTQIEVGASPSGARLTRPGMYPAAVPIYKSVAIVFTARVQGTHNPPSALELFEVDAAGNPIGEIGWLQDNGLDNDLKAGDYVYSGTHTLEPSAEGERYFRVQTIIPGEFDPIVSDTGKLLVTRFPIGAAAPEISTILEDSESCAELVANRVLVSFVDGTSPDTIEVVVEGVGGTVIGFLAGFEHYQVQIPTQDLTELSQVIDILESHPSVRATQRSWMMYPTGVVPSDPWYAFSDQANQKYIQDISADDAWMLGYGENAPNIAIIDSGIDHYHPDLHQDITPEQGFPASNCVNLVQRTSDDKPCIGCVAWDESLHGTMVAGIMAATRNNDIGIAGIFPEGGFLVAKVFGGLTPNSTSSPVVLEAIVTAKNLGSRIINLSLGGELSGFEVLEMERQLRYLDDTVTLIAAAGNNSSTTPFYPAALGRVLSVGGTMYWEGIDIPLRWVNYDKINSGSNYGPWVDLAAPAMSIRSTGPTYSTHYYDPTSMCLEPTLSGLPLSETERLSLGCYARGSGTSFAAPIVSATAGLVLSRFPELNDEQLRERLKKTADPFAGDDEGIGTGQVNTFNALFNGSFEADEHLTLELVGAVRNDFVRRTKPSFIYNQSCSTYASTSEYQWWTYVWKSCYEEDLPLFEVDDHGWYLVQYLRTSSPLSSLITFEHRFGMGGGFIDEYGGGKIRPPHGEKMAYLTTGGLGELPDTISETDLATYTTMLEQRFRIEPGQDFITLSFKYNFVTEELARDLPEDDYFYIQLEVGGQIKILAVHSVYELMEKGELIQLDLQVASGLYQMGTGWKSETMTAALDPSDSGPAVLRIVVRDEYDRLYDSRLFVDDIRLE